MVKSTSTENTTKAPGISTSKKAAVSKSSKGSQPKRRPSKGNGSSVSLIDSVPSDDDAGKSEPDDSSLAQAGNEWNELVVEDPLEILEDPTIALELSEDPVRLYLKEIGQIHLLDADSEFRLAVRIEALVRIENYEAKLKSPRRRWILQSALLGHACEMAKVGRPARCRKNMGKHEIPDLRLCLPKRSY